MPRVGGVGAWCWEPPDSGGSKHHAPLINVGNRYAAAHHSSLQAISTREEGQLPLLVLGLDVAIPGVFWQHGDLRADDEENADARSVPPARTLRAQSYTDRV